MAIINVVFFGLISHVGNRQSKKHAVLIDDFDRHRPHIYFGPRQRINLERGEVTFHDQNGDQIVGRPRCDSDPFQRYVPHLGDLTNGVLKQSVDNGVNREDVYAYVRYPGGALFARTLYHYRAHYRPPPRESLQCVPKTTLLTAEVEAERVFVRYPEIDAGTREEDITDRCILITNAEELRLHGNGAHRFEKHKDIMDATEICSLVQGSRCEEPFEPPPNPICDWIEQVIIHFRDSFEVECANTQYP